MSIERLTKLLLASGQFELLGLGDGEAGFLERTINGQLWESWHLQMDQDDLACASFIHNKKGGELRILTVVSWDDVEGV